MMTLYTAVNQRLGSKHPPILERVNTVNGLVNPVFLKNCLHRHWMLNISIYGNGLYYNCYYHMQLHNPGICQILLQNDVTAEDLRSTETI